MALSRTDYGPYLHDNTGFTPQGTGPFVTGSFTPPANSLITNFVLCGCDAIASESSYVVTGGSLTWTKRDFITFEFATNNGAIVQIWTAPVGSSPASMQITVTHTGVNSYAFGVLPSAYEGYNTSDPVGQFEAAVSTGTTQTLTFGGAPASSSAVIGALMVLANDQNSSDTSVAPGANGGVEISENISTQAFCRWQRQQRLSSTSTSFDWSTTSGAGGNFQNRLYAAIEVKEAAAGGGAQRAVGAGLTESRLLQRTRLIKSAPSMVGWRAQRGLLVPERRLAA